MKSVFRHLPSVDKVLSDERLKQLEKTYPHSLLLNLVRQQLERDRLAIAECDGVLRCAVDRRKRAGFPWPPHQTEDPAPALAPRLPVPAL